MDIRCRLLFSGTDATISACLLACLDSIVLDYVARQKVGGTHLNYFVLNQLPVLPPAAYTVDAPWQPGTAVRDWIAARVLELTYTAWDLAPFARDLGWTGPPFRYDPARRFLLRCELDAAFFHLYGVSRDDADYILDTFPIVRRADEKTYGEYRTKHTILDRYDALANAIATRNPYQTLLDPPPADPRVAHPPRIAPPNVIEYPGPAPARRRAAETPPSPASSTAQPSQSQATLTELARDTTSPGDWLPEDAISTDSPPATAGQARAAKPDFRPHRDRARRGAYR